MSERSFRDIHREQLEILLTHAHEMKAELRTEFENSGLYTGNGAYAVVLFTMPEAFSWDEPDFREKWRNLHNALRETVCGMLQRKYLNHTEIIGDKVCALLCFTGDAADIEPEKIRPEITDMAHRICRSFEDSAGVRVRVAASAVYTGMPGISEAYRDATAIMDYAGFLISPPSVLVQNLQQADEWQREETVVMRGWLDRIMDGIRDSNEQLIYENAEKLIGHITGMPPYGKYYFNLRVQIFIYHFRNALFEANMAHFDFLDQINPVIGLTLAREETSFRRLFYDYLYQVWNNYHNTAHANSMDEANRIKNYLDSHITDVGLSAALAAEKLGMSESSMTYQLKKHVGYTPTEYISRCRAAKARRLIAETRCPIERAAAEVGFGSYLTMHRAFKKYYGAPPSAFREKYNED